MTSVDIYIKLSATFILDNISAFGCQR